MNNSILSVSTIKIFWEYFSVGVCVCVWGRGGGGGGGYSDEPGVCSSVVIFLCAP